MGQADDLKRGITPLFQFWTQHSTLQHKINQCCNLWPDVTVPEKLQIHWYFGIRCFIFFLLCCVLQVLPIYMHIRVLVSAYLFLTGYGHFSYFWNKSDFSVQRYCQVRKILGLIAPFEALDIGIYWTIVYYKKIDLWNNTNTFHAKSWSSLSKFMIQI